MNGLLEILTTKKWMMAPSHLASIRMALQQNLSAHAAFKAENKVVGRVYNRDGEMVKSYCINENGEWVGSSWEAEEVKGPFVNVMDVSGPITRNGGGCSYGSIDHRDMMLTAASNPNCCGHVFVINTPGGSAWAKNDYQQAIDFARSKGQPVIAFVDGMCASAGMYLASLCDERYYMHPNDEIGCIGVMAAFYTEKDGSLNKYTNETYHELYDPKSFDKNKWVRDLANNDDDKAIIDELAALGVEFRNDVKAACPTATDKHLHGRIFAAKDVKGILMDGQSTLGDCIVHCFGIMDGSEKIISRPAATPLTDETSEKENESSTLNDYNMDSKYNNLATACGVEELVITEEGTHLDVSLVDALTEKLDADAKALIEANEKIEALNAQNEEQKAANEKALADREAELNTAHAQAIEDLKAEHATALAEANKAKEEAEQNLAGAQEALTTAENTLADRDAQIKELTEKPADAPDQAPANNGAGIEQATNTYPGYDNSLSPVENARIRKEWMAKHKL